MQKAQIYATKRLNVFCKFPIDLIYSRNMVLLNQMVRILATADWQLGKRFSRAGAGAHRFREQLFLTAQEIIKNTSSDFDIVLIMGDTFDRPDADWQLIERVAELLRSCQKPVHIIPGNHDYWHEGGVLWSLKNELHDTDHVTIHSHQEPFHIESLGLTLFPGILKQRDDLSDRTSWIPSRKKDDGIRIGMFHESLPPFGEFDSNIVENHDLDIALLGDWHGPKSEDSLLDQPEKNLWYAGAPEAQSVNHHWIGRVLSIEIELGEKPVVNPIVIGSLKFTSIEFEFEEDMENPLQLLDEKIEGIEGNPQLTYVKLILTGEATPKTLEMLDDNLAEFARSWPISEVEKGQLRVLTNQENTDATLRQIEAELENMNLEPATMTRAIVLLRRYYRRLA